jgi:hypothetical protein
MPCENCDFSGATLRCSLHPLVFGEVKEMHQATLTGDTWGDIVCDLEAEMRHLETVEQRAERVLTMEKADETRAEVLKQYELQKLQALNVDAKTGALKRTSGRCCRDAEEPAWWVTGKKRLGNFRQWAATDPRAATKPSARPKGVPADAIFWAFGCEPHRSGACPHLHPGQAGYDDAKAGKKPAVESLLRSAVFLSDKPGPKAASGFTDAW